MDGRGFDAKTWDQLAVWTGACATPHDVDTGAAVFALGDTLNGHPLEWMLPQPVIWRHEEEEFAAVVVQAESHEAESGEVLEMLGLVLPGGKTAIAFTDDVEEVDAVDTSWIALIEAELDPLDEDMDEDVEALLAEIDDPDSIWDLDETPDDAVDRDEVAAVQDARSDAEAVHKADEEIEP
jgi:hypothetical protein